MCKDSQNLKPVKPQQNISKQEKAQAVLQLLEDIKLAMQDPSYFTTLGITDELTVDYIKRQFVINLKNITALCTSEVEQWHSVVLYPASARGDMNAYKYVNCGRGPKKVYTIIYYIDRPQDIKNLALNKNMRSFVEHLSSCPFVTVDDHVFLPQLLVEQIRDLLRTPDSTFPTNSLVDYDKYDDWIYNKAVREVAQDAFSKTDVGLEVLSLRVPPEKYLVILNVNGRISADKPYDPREQRHSSDPTILQAFILAVLKHGYFNVMLTGDSPGDLGDLEQHIINATQLWTRGLDRFKQRALLYKVSCKYRATIYVGMQSGVNEDAILLHNVNVFSMCENVGSSQVGLDRVTQKMKVYSTRGKAKFHNFFVIKNSALLTSTGQLAAIQLKHNPLAKYSVSFECFSQEVKKLEAQLAYLKIDKNLIIQGFGKVLIQPNYDPQSDDEGEELQDDESVTYLRRDGFPVSRELGQQLTGPSRFKKISASGLSSRGSKYNITPSGRYVKENQSEIQVEPSEATWVTSILEENSPEQRDNRIKIATLVIGNLLTITVAADCLHVSEEKSQLLFAALFDNVTLLNEQVTSASEISNFQAKPMPKHVRRPSKDYRSGFSLSELDLMTDKQAELYAAQIEREEIKKKEAESRAKDEDLFFPF
ncbi:MAG: hypothetical protein WC782_13910 [Methylococcaceae bacterium]|jgi:hypothetical protein